MHLRPVKQPHLFFATTTTAAPANSAFSPTDLHQGLYPPRCQAPEFSETPQNRRTNNHQHSRSGPRLFSLPHEGFQVPSGAKIHEQIQMAAVLKPHAHSPKNDNMTGAERETERDERVRESQRRWLVPNRRWWFVRRSWCLYAVQQIYSSTTAVECRDRSVSRLPHTPDTNQAKTEQRQSTHCACPHAEQRSRADTTATNPSIHRRQQTMRVAHLRTWNAV